MKKIRGFACIGTAVIVFCLLIVRPFWVEMVIQGIQQSQQNHRETEAKKVADVDQWIKDGSATVTRDNDIVSFTISKSYQWCTGQWRDSAQDRDNPTLIQDPATCADSALAWVAQHYVHNNHTKVVPGLCTIMCSSVSHYRILTELNKEDIHQAQQISSTSHHKLVLRLDEVNDLLIIKSVAQKEMYQSIGTPFGTWRSMREARCVAWRRAPTNTAVHTEKFTLTIPFRVLNAPQAERGG